MAKLVVFTTTEFYCMTKSSVYRRFNSTVTVKSLDDVWISLQTKGDYSSAARKANTLLSITPENSLQYSYALIAAMAANSCAKNAGTVRQLFKSLPISDISHPKKKRALELLLHAYCVADNISSTENLLNDWMSFLFKDSVTVAASNLLNDVKSRRLNHNLENDTELKEKIDCILNDLKSSSISPSIPLRSWSSVVRFYSHRQAWVQCLKVLDFLEEQFPKKVSPESHSILHYGPHSDRILWNLVDAQCLLGVSKDVSVRPDSFFDEMDDADVYMAWLSIYHHTVDALCECDQFDEALTVLERMRGRGLRPLVTALPSLLRAYISPAPSSRYMPVGWQETATAGPADSPEVPVTRGNVDVLLAAHAELLRPLHRDILAAVLQLGQADKESGRSRAAFLLLKSYMNVLCQLNLVEVAEEALDLMRSQCPQIALKMPVLYPLIHAHSMRGDWKAAKTVFLLGASSSQRERDGQGAGRRSIVGTADEQQRRRSSEDCYPMAYHTVCDAIRKAGMLIELSEFISLHSPK